MYPHGTIYHIYSPEASGNHGEVSLHAPLKIKLLYALLRGLGSGLIGLVIISIVFTFSPIVKEELWYYLGLNKPKISQSNFGQLLDLAKADEVTRVQKEASLLGIDSYFSLYIPKINAKSKIIANVNAGDEKEYVEALSEGVAHAAGTYFPGQGENIFLFSHSTNAPWNIVRYNAIFYLLGKLEKGDTIIVFFGDKKYEYQVSEKVKAGAKDTSWLTQNTAEERLVLQTCDPPGTTWQRLLVIAKPVDKGKVNSIQ